MRNAWIITDYHVMRNATAMLHSHKLSVAKMNANQQQLNAMKAKKLLKNFVLTIWEAAKESAGKDAVVKLLNDYESLN